MTSGRQGFYRDTSLWNIPYNFPQRNNLFGILHFTPHDPYSNNNTSLEMSTKTAGGLGHNHRYRGFPGQNMDSPRQPIFGEKPRDPDLHADFRKLQHLNPERPLGKAGYAFEYGSDGQPQKSEGPRPLGNPLQDKTSADLLKHRKQMEIAERDIQEFKDWKRHQISNTEQEKRRDMEMLKNYNPWGKAGGGAPNQKEDARFQRFGDEILHNPATEVATEKQYYPSFGSQGGGAPLRTSSGKLVTEMPKDPQIRFQSDLRRTEPMIEPFRYAPGRANASNYHKELDRQVHEKLIKQQDDKSTDLKQDEDMMMYAPFGKPGAGAPLKSKTDRAMSKSENNFPVYDPFGKGTGQPMRDQQGNVMRHRNSNKDTGVISYNGASDGVSLDVGKFGSGGGAPLKTKDGDAMTRIKITMDKDAFGENRFNMDHPLHQKDPRPFSDGGYDSWWGRGGAGAPIKDEQGKTVTTRRREVDSGDEKRKLAASDLRQELQREMIEQERNKKEMNDSFKQPASDLASIMNKGQTGKPRRDPYTGTLVNNSLNASDVTRMAVDERRQVSINSKQYHDDLQSMAEERQRRKQLERLREERDSMKHQQTYESYFGREGAGAPVRANANRKPNLENILNSPRREHNEYHKVTSTVSGTVTDTDSTGPRGVYVRSTLNSNHKNQFEFDGKRQRREYSVSAPWANH